MPLPIAANDGRGGKVPTPRLQYHIGMSKQHRTIDQILAVDTEARMDEARMVRDWYRRHHGRDDPNTRSVLAICQGAGRR